MPSRPREPVRAYVGLGSNLDDPVAQVRSALDELGELPHTLRVAQSSLYRSPPMGPAGQPDYVNAVAVLDTGLEPRALLRELQAIEARHGRVRGAERWGPRTLGTGAPPTPVSPFLTRASANAPSCSGPCSRWRRGFACPAWASCATSSAGLTRSSRHCREALSDE